MHQRGGSGRLCRRLAATMALLWLSACYRVPLAPGTRPRLGPVLVAVGFDQPPTRIGTLNVHSSQGAGGSWHQSLRDQLVSALLDTGWRAQALLEIPPVQSGALFDAPWPPRLCVEVEKAGAEVALWVVPHPTWEPSTAQAVVTIDVTAHLVQCRGKTLLWRDRVMRRIMLRYAGEMFAPRFVTLPPMEADDAAMQEALLEIVTELLASLNQGQGELAPVPAASSP